MADFFAKGKNPINGYTEPLPSGMVKMEKLWANPNPIATFAGQNVDVLKDGNTYDAFIIMFGDSYNESVTTTWGKSGGLAYARYVFVNSIGRVVDINRNTIISDGGTYYRFAFTDCTKATLNTYGSSPASATDNTTMIPTFIFGIIHND
jgi:hypothetical protein